MPVAPLKTWIDRQTARRPALRRGLAVAGALLVLGCLALTVFTAGQGG
ncbi:hypothetical protein SAMN04490244_11842 [Tranquillimonas rosea]|uniref:Uncharacterized protein n=1 Tax=Tranquillimonas rosea TaxID=641238 RepID=A0A1H9X511_9RHOB|nr:hypothetical protein [Tranquillimonas rosea]SES41286.1 hypothetical protein SAMN04490244_11842 [Tranquillimonas rosea]